MRSYFIKYIGILFAHLVCISGLHAADKIELSGTYQVRIICGEDGHEERFYLVEPGPDKFSGKYHLLSLAPELRKGLVSGARIRMLGEKQADQRKMLSKGQIRKDMYEYLKDGKGIPYESEDLSEIIAKLVEKDPDHKPQADNENAAQDTQHKHPPLRLKKMADDDQVVEVRVPEHIAVSQIEIVR